MNATTQMLVKGAGIADASFALCFAAAPGAHAKRKNANAYELRGTVAHLPLKGSAVSNMSLQEANGHQYLYLNRASKEGVTIVDVTNPGKPMIGSNLSWPSGDHAGHFKNVRRLQKNSNWFGGRKDTAMTVAANKQRASVSS